MYLACDTCEAQTPSVHCDTNEVQILRTRSCARQHSNTMPPLWSSACKPEFSLHITHYVLFLLTMHVVNTGFCKRLEIPCGIPCTMTAQDRGETAQHRGETLQNWAADPDNLQDFEGNLIFPACMYNPKWNWPRTVQMRTFKSPGTVWSCLSTFLGWRGQSVLSKICSTKYLISGWSKICIIARLARADLKVVHALWLGCGSDLLRTRVFALSPVTEYSRFLFYLFRFLHMLCGNRTKRFTQGIYKRYLQLKIFLRNRYLCKVGRSSHQAHVAVYMSQKKNSRLRCVLWFLSRHSVYSHQAQV